MGKATYLLMPHVVIRAMLYTHQYSILFYAPYYSIPHTIIYDLPQWYLSQAILRAR